MGLNNTNTLVSENKSTKQVFQSKYEMNNQSKFSKVSKTTLSRNNFQKKDEKQFSLNSKSQLFQTPVSRTYRESYLSNPKVDFIPQNPNFPNHTKKQTLKFPYEKGITPKRNIDHWLEGKGKMYQSSKFSNEQIHKAYEKYVNTSLNGSSSSKDSNIYIYISNPGNLSQKRRLLYHKLTMRRVWLVNI